MEQILKLMRTPTGDCGPAPTPSTWTPRKADEWRRRIGAWSRFRLRGEQRRARTLNYSAVLLDDPDPRRCGNVLKV